MVATSTTRVSVALTPTAAPAGTAVELSRVISSSSLNILWSWRQMNDSRVSSKEEDAGETPNDQDYELFSKSN